MTARSGRRVGILILFMVIMLLWGGHGTVLAGAASSSRVVDLTILAINDFHGALLESGNNPGMVKLGAYLKTEKAKNARGTLLLSAGDMFQGSLESNLLYGKTVVEAMNNIGFDAMAVGNHEFDWGTEQLIKQTHLSLFPYLGANVLNRKTGKTAAFLKRYIIVQRNGIKVGIIGLTTPEAAYKSNPRMVSGFEFADPVTTLEQLIPEVRGKGAQIIIVVSHMGCEIDKNSGEIIGEAADVAARVPGIDALVTGHSHTQVIGTVRGTPVVQAGYNGRNVAQITLRYSPMEKRVLSSTSRLVDIAELGLAEDKKMRALVEQSQAEIAPVKNEILGQTVTNLNHNRFELSVLGQWCTDGIRQATNADIAFQNGGGLRSSIAAGTITLGNLYEVLPFDNTIYTIELTGRQVLEVLQYGIDNENIGTVQFSGIRVIEDKERVLGQRVVRVALLDGTPLNLEKNYKIATNDFMIEGGDGFSTFRQGKNICDTGVLVRDVLKAMVIKQQTVHFDRDDRLEKVEAASLQPAA